jgi:hypothetical protein
MRLRDGLADGLRDTSARLWRLAEGIDTSTGRPITPRQARNTAAVPVALCSGLLAGMGVMYLLDRRASRRQRALLRDQMTHYRRVAEHLLDRKGRDLGNRVRGLVLERMKHVRDEVVDDAVLVERIRSHMGHLLSHVETRRIEVAVAAGQVTLSGQVVASHVNRVLGHVATVPGVRGLVTKLTVHPSVQDMLDEQPGMQRPEQQMNRVDQGLQTHGPTKHPAPSQPEDVPAAAEQPEQSGEQQSG